MNTADDAKVMAWWDYGYQMSSMANRTTILDNNTWNNTHIATVGRAMASSEEDACVQRLTRLVGTLGVDSIVRAGTPSCEALTSTMCSPSSAASRATRFVVGVAWCFWGGTRLLTRYGGW